MFGYEFNPKDIAGWGASNSNSTLILEQTELHIPDKALFLLTEHARFKVLHGGRGSAKSWSMAQALIVKAHQERPMIKDARTGLSKPGSHLILCAREYQNSIADSVHKLLCDAIWRLNLEAYFDIQKTQIVSKRTGAMFIFKGLHHNIREIKSTEGITICWVEEAQAVSKDSWETLIPTVRGIDGAEIWVSYNPYLSDDPTSKLFQGTDPAMPVDPRAIVVELNFSDNPWFPADMEEDRLALLRIDPDAYEHIYGGAFLQISEATIFRNRYEVRPFETPPDARLLYGLDFGFADDPSFGVRAWVDNRDNTLYIDHEAYGLHVEIDDLHALVAGGHAAKNGMDFPGLPGADQWPIKADGSRPETISYLRRQGLNVSAADKWPGSVEDGIAHLKGFSKIVIHERCKQLAREARLYKYKVDKQTNDILPIIVDKHNHGWDALRYALDGFIQARGGMGVWMKLAGKPR